MFRNRANSQKPNDELYASFKATFPQLTQPSRSIAGATSQSSSSLANALDVALHPRQFMDGDDMKDHDDTPRGSNDQWRLTPSLLDPNSFAFASFANQPPGYYTPTSGGTSALYHSQAGDLHTPGFSLGLGTPLSLPTSEVPLHGGQVSTAPMHAFHAQVMAPHMFQNENPFAFQSHQAFAPHQFSHQPADYDPMQQTQEDSPLDGVQDGMHVDLSMQDHSPVLTFPQHLDGAMHPPLVQQPMENFRFHVTLNAPTAMIKHADEIPVTYLNKGQAYSISIVDTASVPMTAAPARYRTFVRISFEDEQQRQRPAACWQLWKEGRGTNEAHHRGGKLQAVEFVDQSQISGGDVSGRPRVDLESASFDGFCVNWTPMPSAPAECTVAVRFNFLSTDFSHSKGVKGIPVRLCAKTECVSTQAPTSPERSLPEIAYCKVKLFRDHGAERKLSNDIAHVKKTIDKLKQQIAQAESGMKDFGKRKRSGSVTKGSASSRPGKVPKHKRTWSMSSASSNSNRISAEDDTQLKLATLQDMFTSTRPASVLYLKGEELDDPDLHPVHLSGEPQDLTKVDTGDATMWDKQSVRTNGASSMVSPTPSVQSIQSGGRRTSGFTQPTPFAPSRGSSNEWRNNPQTATSDIQPVVSQQLASPPDMPARVQKVQPGGHDPLTGWIEALGVDYSYQPPPERAIKPVACFYVQPRVVGKKLEDNYYRAVYLMQRTLKDFVNGIATKCNIAPTQVLRTVRVNKESLQILMDDEEIRELPEGQDMIAEFHGVRSPSPVKREWDAGPTDIQVDGDVAAIRNVSSEGYELKLLF